MRFFFKEGTSAQLLFMHLERLNLISYLHYVVFLKKSQLLYKLMWK